MSTKRFCALCSESNFPLILTLVFAIYQLQFGVSPVSASSRLWIRGVDANTTRLLAAVCPPSIGFGETIQCSILSTGEMDTYTFAASAGDKVLVRMSRSSGDIVPEIRVYSPDGTKLCEAYNSFPAEIASCTLPSPGTYSILADDLLGTHASDYFLYLQRLNNPGNAVPIGHGQVLSGSVTTAGEMDTYTFTASAGDKVLVRVSKSAGSLWAAVRVYGPNGTKLCEADGSDTATIPSCSMPSTGTYTILVYDGFNGTYTGDYRLYLDCCSIYLPAVLKG